ncbi:MAG: glucose-6-phosphate isomerase [Gammaproteobacteria bacterium]|nr:MAG: glucose-6-phosphate isomerase [Gammaproteobacteria bacterium]
MNNRSDRPSWKALDQHYSESKDIHLNDLFENDPERFSKFSIEAAGLFLDYSKNHLSAETLDFLAVLANESCLKERIADLFAGKKLNNTENRAVLHTALRNFSEQPVYVDGQDVMPAIMSVQHRMRALVESVHLGGWRGFSGKRITDIVNIGIGGSDLGPRMVVSALSRQAVQEVDVHFVSNVDGEELSQRLSKLSPETTLFVVVSKTFTTLETMTNARSAKKWLLAGYSDNAAIANHFVAVSANLKAVKAFGINPDNSFEIWDWVGGRFSLWSAVGLSIALAVGMDSFERLLKGAYLMDEHFSQSPLLENMPVILALVGIWNRNFQKASSVAVLPYDHRLSRFPAYLQQCDMESNGKSVDREGHPITVETSPVIWGEVGTNGQHAFYQSLHQGTQPVPADFIVALKSDCNLKEHHKLLVANCFAQSEALMKGKTAEEVCIELKKRGLNEREISRLVGHETFDGNRPSNTILMDRLTPEALGALIALYEHKISVQGIIWDINSFDQWGVELGKQLANVIVEEIDGGLPGRHDSSTHGLLTRYHLVQK